jgi:peptide chain release factor subunit 3
MVRPNPRFNLFILTNSYKGQPQYAQFQQQPQQTQKASSQPVPTIAKRSEQASAATSDLNKPVTTKEGGAKVLSIGGDAPKPKAAAKVLSIGVPAPPKDEQKEESKDDAATAGAKMTATKAIEKTGETTKSASGKTSPTPSSGRSSPTRGAGAKLARDIDAVVNEQTADVDEETLKEIYGKEHVNVIFLGHVDAGKSTLGGSILYATGMVDERTSKYAYSGRL